MWEQPPSRRAPSHLPSQRPLLIHIPFPAAHSPTPLLPCFQRLVLDWFPVNPHLGPGHPFLSPGGSPTPHPSSLQSRPRRHRRQLPVGTQTPGLSTFPLETHWVRLPSAPVFTRNPASPSVLESTGFPDSDPALSSAPCARPSRPLPALPLCPLPRAEGGPACTPSVPGPSPKARVNQQVRAA